MVTTRYMGVYWVKQKKESPGDGTICVFHRKGNKENNIRFGYYAFGGFYEKIGKNKYQRIDQRHIDYWMAIPVFPDEWSVVRGRWSVVRR